MHGLYLEFWKTLAGAVVVILLVLAMGEKTSKRTNMFLGGVISLLAGYSLGSALAYLARFL